MLFGGEVEGGVFKGGKQKQKQVHSRHVKEDHVFDFKSRF